MMNKLNLGCGLDYKKGFINADLFSNADIKMDFNEKFPFKNNYFNEIYMRHALEHAKDRNFTLKEIYRVSKDNALMTIIVPHSSNPDAMTDLGHYSAFNYSTFSKTERTHKRKYQYDFHFKNITFKYTKVRLPLHLNKYNFLNNFSVKCANKLSGLWEFHISSVLPIMEIEYKMHIDKPPKTKPHKSYPQTERKREIKPAGNKALL